MGTTWVASKPSSDQRYFAWESYLLMLGKWQVEVVVRKPGFDDVRHAFDVDLEKWLGE